MIVERTTVRLPEELMRRAKRRAAEEGRTLTALIEDAVRRALSQPKGAKVPRKMPRVSAATGGLWPGVDLSNNAAVQEIEDAEYLERMRHFK